MSATEWISNLLGCAVVVGIVIVIRGFLVGEWAESISFFFEERRRKARVRRHYTVTYGEARRFVDGVADQAIADMRRYAAHRREVVKGDDL